VLSHKFLPPAFRCDVESDGNGTVRVRLAGELDMSTVPVLAASLEHARAAGHDLIVIDLRALEFMDSTGLTLLTRWSLGSERDGFALALVAGNERIQRLFELTRLITHFKFVDG
jgi:anti-sigma B factor antagonist